LKWHNSSAFRATSAIEAGSVNQSLPNADTTLGGFPQDDASVIAIADQFDGNFLFLDFVHDLDRALKRVCERR
jgi:hypothetical protein